MPFCHSVPLLSPPISPHPKAPPSPAPLIQLLSRDKSPTSLLPIALSPSLLSLPPFCTTTTTILLKGGTVLAMQQSRDAVERREERRGGRGGWPKKEGPASSLSNPLRLSTPIMCRRAEVSALTNFAPSVFSPDRRALQTRISIHQCDYNIKRYTHSTIYVEQLLYIITLMPYYRTLYRESTVQHTIHVPCRYIHSTYVRIR